MSRNLAVVFQDQAQCTRVHRLGVQKRCKIGKKGMFIGHIDQILEWT